MTRGSEFISLKLKRLVVEVQIKNLYFFRKVDIRFETIQNKAMNIQFGLEEV